MATAQTLADITPTEAAHVLNYFGLGGFPAGSFTQALINAFALADPENFARLTREYPGYGAAVDIIRSHDDGITMIRRAAHMAA